MSAPYTTADAMFDAEAMGHLVCPRHGVGCECCHECGLASGRHEARCPMADEPTVAESFTTQDAVAELRSRALPLVVVALFLVLGIGACTATAPVPEVETVGALAPSYRSIATAPVHATTDLAPTAMVETASDDEARAVVVETGEAPEVASKGGGIVAGSVR